MRDLIIRVDQEDDGEGWFECRVCGLHVGFCDIEEAREEADMHDTGDCADELAWSA